MSFTLLDRKERKAAKVHRCIWCWQHIEAGERYMDERSVYDGELQVHKWHPECLEAMEKEASEEGGMIEWTPGQERPVKTEVQS